MKKLIRRILKEEVDDLFYDDAIINKPGYGESGYENLDKSSDFVRYNVFVSGIESKWGYKTQRLSFDGGYSSSLPVKQFRYKSSDDWNKNVLSIFKNFLSDNIIDKVILFSAGCYAANTAADIVGSENVYCIEPYKTNNKWSMIPAKNFYVNEKIEIRGSVSKEGIPDENKNNFYGEDGHIDALEDAVSKIF